jgi:uncharacterized protein YqfB (UPF0267 family)
MELNDLKSKYDKLLKDEDFDKLDLGLKNPNIFQILRISKNEIRHSNFLSWLLDPNQSHKLGDIFLKRFLREVFSSDKFGEVDQVDVEGLDLNKVEIRREWKNIDILLILENVIVCVENKVFSKEHSNQLKRYREVIENQFPNHHQTYVFLTPEGEISENESDVYEPISYQFVVETLERILSVYGESLVEQVRTYIKDYITILKRELMGTDKLTELSQKIYQNHKDLFDFVFEHKPEIVDELSKVMKEEVLKRGWRIGSENKYYVRFLTPKTEPFVFYNTETKNGWNKRESFLFEILLYPSTNKFNFKTVLSPSDSKYHTEKVEEILLSIPGFRESKGKKWLVNIDIKESFKFDEINNMSDEELRTSVNRFLDKISPTVEKVELKFEEEKDLLLSLKNV